MTKGYFEQIETLNLILITSDIFLKKVSRGLEKTIKVLILLNFYYLELSYYEMQ